LRVESAPYRTKGGRRFVNKAALGGCLLYKIKKKEEKIRENDRKEDKALADSRSTGERKEEERF